MNSFQISRLPKTDAASVEDCRDGELMSRSAKWKKGSKAASEWVGGGVRARRKVQVIGAPVQYGKLSASDCNDGAPSLQKTNRAQLMPLPWRQGCRELGGGREHHCRHPYYPAIMTTLPEHYLHFRRLNSGTLSNNGQQNLLFQIYTFFKVYAAGCVFFLCPAPSLWW